MKLFWNLEGNYQIVLGLSPIGEEITFDTPMGKYCGKLADAVIDELTGDAVPPAWMNLKYTVQLEGYDVFIDGSYLPDNQLHPGVLLQDPLDDEGVAFDLKPVFKNADYGASVIKHDNSRVKPKKEVRRPNMKDFQPWMTIHFKHSFLETERESPVDRLLGLSYGTEYWTNPEAFNSLPNEVLKHKCKALYKLAHII